MSRHLGWKWKPGAMLQTYKKYNCVKSRLIQFFSLHCIFYPVWKKSSSFSCSPLGISTADHLLDATGWPSWRNASISEGLHQDRHLSCWTSQLSHNPHTVPLPRQKELLNEVFLHRNDLMKTWHYRSDYRPSGIALKTRCLKHLFTVSVGVLNQHVNFCCSLFFILHLK